MSELILGTVGRISQLNNTERYKYSFKEERSLRQAALDLLMKDSPFSGFSEVVHEPDKKVVEHLYARYSEWGVKNTKDISLPNGAKSVLYKIQDNDVGTLSITWEKYSNRNIRSEGISVITSTYNLSKENILGVNDIHEAAEITRFTIRKDLKGIVHPEISKALGGMLGTLNIFKDMMKRGTTPIVDLENKVRKQIGIPEITHYFAMMRPELYNMIGSDYCLPSLEIVQNAILDRTNPSTIYLMRNYPLYFLNNYDLADALSQTSLNKNEWVNRIKEAKEKGDTNIHDSIRKAVTNKRNWEYIKSNVADGPHFYIISKKSLENNLNNF